MRFERDLSQLLRGPVTEGVRLLGGIIHGEIDAATEALLGSGSNGSTFSVRPLLEYARAITGDSGSQKDLLSRLRKVGSNLVVGCPIMQMLLLGDAIPVAARLLSQIPPGISFDEVSKEIERIVGLGLLSALKGQLHELGSQDAIRSEVNDEASGSTVSSRVMNEDSSASHQGEWVPPDAVWPTLRDLNAWLPHLPEDVRVTARPVMREALQFVLKKTLAGSNESFRAQADGVIQIASIANRWRLTASELTDELILPHRQSAGTAESIRDLVLIVEMLSSIARVKERAGESFRSIPMEGFREALNVLTETERVLRNAAGRSKEVVAMNFRTLGAALEAQVQADVRAVAAFHEGQVGRAGMDEWPRSPKSSNSLPARGVVFPITSLNRLSEVLNRKTNPSVDRLLQALDLGALSDLLTGLCKPYFAKDDALPFSWDLLHSKVRVAMGCGSLHELARMRILRETGGHAVDSNPNYIEGVWAARNCYVSAWKSGVRIPQDEHDALEAALNRLQAYHLEKISEHMTVSEDLPPEMAELLKVAGAIAHLRVLQITNLKVRMPVCAALGIGWHPWDRAFDVLYPELPDNPGHTLLHWGRSDPKKLAADAGFALQSVPKAVRDLKRKKSSSAEPDLTELAAVVQRVCQNWVQVTRIEALTRVASQRATPPAPASPW